MSKRSAKTNKFAKLVLACAVSASLACGVAPAALAKAAAGAVIGSDEYATLDEALAAASGAKGTTHITLLGDASGRFVIDDGMDVEIDLNGHEIANDTVPLAVFDGSLKLTGEGAVKETAPEFAPVVIEGNDVDVEIDENVELEGWSGLMVDQLAEKNVNVEIAGTVNAVVDANGDSGHGVYVNCDSRNTGKDAPQVTLTETSKVNSAGNGIYAAGYANWNLNGTVEADADAISVKSGDITVEGGSYHSKGAYHETPKINNNGAEATGAALSITSNDNYAGNVNVQVNGGQFVSDNGYAVYEGIAADKSNKAAKASAAKITINGGEFKSAKGKEFFAITQASEKLVKIAEMFVPKAEEPQAEEPKATEEVAKAEKTKKSEKPATQDKQDAEETDDAADDASDSVQADEDAEPTVDEPAEEDASEL